MMALIWICASVCAVWFVGVGIFFLRIGSICDKEIEAVYVGEVFRGVRFEYEVGGKRMENTAIKFDGKAFEIGKSYIIYVCARHPRIFVTTRKRTLGDIVSSVLFTSLGILMILITWLATL